MTVLGTRPEIIRLSRVVDKLDRLCEHVLVHTGQNYATELSDVFFAELGIRPPDEYLGIREDSFGAQIGRMIAEGERVLKQERPDRLLVLGDTNSSLCAIVAKRLGIPVFHMEAGNRCYDDRVPEEINRRVIDHSSDVLMPYTERSRTNLLREGFASDRIFVIGNPIYEVLKHYEPSIRESDVLGRLGLRQGGYVLVTMHREENVDDPERLRSLVRGLELIGGDLGVPVLCSVHPRTRSMMQRHDVAGDKLRLHDPFGFIDFVGLEQHALCVLSDSGTVQEECCVLRVANVTIRDVTERPETVEAGSNMLSGVEPESLRLCVRTVLDGKALWRVPPEYLVEDVSSTVAKLVLGFQLDHPVGAWGR
jgi:UDP-N-acetylglucosamine 2-epimerase (non-hydrolysing)